MTSLIPNVGAGALLEQHLLGKDHAIRVGAIHRLDYHEAVVLTHDLWKLEAGGIPQFSFLLATARNINEYREDDDEVLLLRVDGTAPLTLESDLHAVREEALREALSKDRDASPGNVLDIDMDPFTKNRASFTGLRCKILGTFYEENYEGMRRLEFGADVDNFYATSTYRVLKPLGEGLSTIASFLKPSPHPVQRMKIGNVRYSATMKRARTSGQAAAPVEVNIHDFIGHKTGLLGMTRTGKSNTAKILIARTFLVSQQRASRRQHPIGQLIFDPQGEYANDNPQDKTAIAAIGTRHVRIFKFGADGSQPHVKPLGVNFYDPAQIETVQAFIADKLRTDGASGYINDFGATTFIDVPNKPSETARAGRGRFLLYAALYRAGFSLPPGYSVSMSMKAELATALNTHLKGAKVRITSGKGHVLGEDLVAVANAIIAVRDDEKEEAAKARSLAADFCEDIRWSSTEPIFTGTTSGRNVRGYRNLIDLKDYHNPSTQQDVADEIYAELQAGRVVIVDLHVGSQPIVSALSETVTRRILKNQTAIFTSGSERELPPIQIMLEEAHNLFSKERYSADKDVWVRLAKEAAKLNIGMIYATQEVSGVAHQVKANTANWVVAHLNNRTELNELAKFYDFSSFADAILASEDRGFVRLKTLSSPYIVPVQVERYDESLVNEARAAAGDPPLGAEAVIVPATTHSAAPQFDFSEIEPLDWTEH